LKEIEQEEEEEEDEDYLLEDKRMLFTTHSLRFYESLELICVIRLGLKL
jgi:hypothetical protein